MKDTKGTAKQALRENLKRVRDELPGKLELSQRIVGKVLGLEEYRKAQILVAYFAIRSEVDPAGLVSDAFDSGKEVYAPWVLGDSLKLCPVQTLEQLKKGAYGILEPEDSIKSNSLESFDHLAAGLVLVPALGFDLNGFRIGYGGGYYDRFLAQLPNTVFSLGLAFNCQVIENLPLESHDQPVKALVTEQNIHYSRL